MLLAIDADSMVYAYGFAYEGQPLPFAKKAIADQVQRLTEDAGADYVKLFLGGVGNFRDEIAVTYPYKGTRTSKRPTHYAALRDYLYDTFDTTMCDGFEADDAVSLLLWEEHLRSREKGGCNLVVASGDKDVRNTPGHHMHIKTRDITYIPAEDADRNFYTQLLTGDSVDNIRGLPTCSKITKELYGLHAASLMGCGSKSAEKILKDVPFGSLYERVESVYLSWGEQQGYCKEEILKYLLEQGRLLWMTRELDDDFEPVMWELPKEKE